MVSTSIMPYATWIGTIHILRKHFYSTFHKNWVFFVKTKEFLFQHYILTKFSCCSEIFSTYIKKNAQKIRENVAVDKKVLT